MTRIVYAIIFTVLFASIYPLPMHGATVRRPPYNAAAAVYVCNLKLTPSGRQHIESLKEIYGDRAIEQIAPQVSGANCSKIRATYKILGYVQ